MPSIFDQVRALSWDVLARTYVMGFQDLPEECVDRVRTTRKFYASAKKTMEALDEKMTPFILDKHSEDFVTWAAIMKIAVEKLQQLERNIVAGHGPGWNWPEVINAMAILEAMKVSMTNILANEGIDLNLE